MPSRVLCAARKPNGGGRAQSMEGVSWITSAGAVRLSAAEAGAAANGERTIASLDLPPDIEVTQYAVNKVKVKVKSKGRLDPKLKLLKGDEISLCGAPHRLSLLTEAKNGKLIVCAKARSAESDALGKGIELLKFVGNKLAAWLQSAVRIRIAQRTRARRSCEPSRSRASATIRR